MKSRKDLKVDQRRGVSLKAIEQNNATMAKFDKWLDSLPKAPAEDKSTFNKMLRAMQTTDPADLPETP